MKNLISLFAFFAICNLTSIASVINSYQNENEIGVMCWGEGEENFTSDQIGDPNKMYDIDIYLILGPEYSNHEISIDCCCVDRDYSISYANGIGGLYDYTDYFEGSCTASGKAFFWVDYYSEESDVDPDAIFNASFSIAQ